MKASEKSIRWIWVLNCAALGYAFAVGAFAVRTITYFPEWVVETLVPMVNFTSLVPVDPDLGVALCLWGPVNAVLYGLIGLFVSQKQIDRRESSP
jgi:hypothetical protein